MISVTAAKKIVAGNQLVLPVIQMLLQDALLLRLAENVYSPVNVPAFTQSSMDGYAFAYADWQHEKKLTIRGEMQAGSRAGFTLQTGEAARIFTGAPLPAGADTVVMQEKVTTNDKELIISDAALQAGSNARAVGSAIKAGELALEKENILSPGAIGFLAGMGITHVSVFARPSVGIIVTGNELQQPGNTLAYGEIYESNSVALKTALQQIQISAISSYHAMDDSQELKKILNEALANNDLVLLSGGVSVGDYDFVVQAAADCGVEKLFHKIKQRPGKPLYFGKKANKLVVGLPGNPSSVLSCFYEYVLPLLKVDLPVLQVPLAKAYKKPAGLTHFLKASYNGASVMPLDAQESYRMSSFAKANCLLQLDEEITECKEGQLAEIHLLPF